MTSFKFALSSIEVLKMLSTIVLNIFCEMILKSITKYAKIWHQSLSVLLYTLVGWLRRAFIKKTICLIAAICYTCSASPHTAMSVALINDKVNHYLLRKFRVKRNTHKLLYYLAKVYCP